MKYISLWDLIEERVETKTSRFGLREPSVRQGGCRPPDYCKLEWLLQLRWRLLRQNLYAKGVSVRQKGKPTFSRPFLCISPSSTRTGSRQKDILTWLSEPSSDRTASISLLLCHFNTMVSFSWTSWAEETHPPACSSWLPQRSSSERNAPIRRESCTCSWRLLCICC
jgi:hypothetical protein